jgi:carbamate kinase
MRVVVALGGNALLRRGERPNAETQLLNVKTAVHAIAELAREHEVVVTHGNGPQVGVIALESENDPVLAAPYPLDVLGAETEGMIGYWLEQQLSNELPDRRVATLLTQTVVDADDHAFKNPTKFIGQIYTAAEARDRAAQRGWTMRADGDSWRRVVASPQPKRIVEAAVIKLLVANGVLVVCAGGGGIPVVQRDSGALFGVEAVVDKDFAAALLGRLLDADLLLMLTDVAAIQSAWGTPEARDLAELTVDQAAGMTLAAGSMGPKLEAACRFVRAGGQLAAIGALADAAAIVHGTAGTRIVR